MICEYCEKELASIASLKHHQKHAKYCKDKRGDNNSELYSCIGCKLSFTTKRRLQTHHDICVLYNTYKIHQECDTKIDIKDIEILELKVQIRELQDKLENIAIQAVRRPTTMNNKTQINNFIQAMPPVTEQLLQESVPNLTIDHIIRGPEGYADYALEFPLKDRLICVDYARRKIKFKDKDNNIITDPEMTCLATKFFQSIKERNSSLILEYGKQMRDRFGDEMDTIIQLLDYKGAVDKGSEGEKTDFHHDFIKQMCSQTIKE